MSADPLADLTGGLFTGDSLTGATGGLLGEELHPRTLIRKHVTQRLKNASAAVDRVFASRKVPIKAEKLRTIGPILCVYTLSDQVAGMVSEAPPIYEFHLEVVVEALCVSDLPDIEDTLDALALAIEAVVLRDETQGGNAAKTHPLGTVTAFVEEGEFKGCASQILRFQVEYQRSAEDLVGDSLEKVHTDWKPPAVTAHAPETKDELTLEGSDTE